MSAGTLQGVHADEPHPPGAFQWTPHWRRLLPAWRREGLAPRPAPPALEACLAAYREGVARARARLANSPTLWATLGATRQDQLFELPPGGLSGTPVLADWSTLFGHVLLSSRQYHGRAFMASAVWRVADAAHGLAFAIEVLLDGVQAASPLALDHATLMENCELAELRARCAAAGNDEYARILAVAHAHAPRSGLLAALAAWLLPDEAALVEGALAALGESAPSHAARPQLLAGCELTPAQFEHLLRHYGRGFGLFDETRVLLLNAVRCGHPRSLELALQRADQDHYQEHRRQYFEIARAHDSAAALAAFVARFADKDARTLLDPFAHAWPQLAIRLAAERCVAGDAALRDWLQRLAAAQRAALAAAIAAAPDPVRALLLDIQGSLGAELAEAPDAALPDWLRAPPWRAGRRPPKPRWPTLATQPFAPRLAWAEGERTRWLAGLSAAGMQVKVRAPELLGLEGEAHTAALLRQFGIPDAAHARALAGERIARAELGRKRFPASGIAVLLPPLAARAVLWSWGPEGWYHMPGSQLEQMVAWLDELALPMLEDFADEHLERGLQLAQPLASARVAVVAANALRSSRKCRALAQNWLLRHARVAAGALLPLLGARKGAEDASFALRWLLANGREDEVVAAAEAYGADGRSTLATLRAFDPLQLAPPKAPALPDFWLPNAWPRPRLRDGRALPAGALDAIGEMLAFTPLEPRYAGIEHLRELCSERSLGAFAWALFEAWLDAGAPGKAQWAFAALAHLGDDECARQLAKRIRAWPSEGASGRAATGLDVLAAMGSDLALMLLAGIAQKVKSKPLQVKAQAKLEQLALVRGLSEEELADRVVPDLGLGEDGTLTLDFGPRRFTVGFDEHLKPQVRDAGGAPLKDLPAPGKSDDAALAEAAVAKWKALRKDARTLASQQLRRLEEAMVLRRRWRLADFRACLVEHPLLRQLVRRLLWVAYADGAAPRGFRVAEDLSFADARDDLLTLAEDASVGLAHPLDLAADDLAAFTQVFADYEIAQPFVQLGLEVWRLSDEERAATTLTRCAGRKVAIGSLVGLEARGWRKDELSTESGRYAEAVRGLGEGRRVRLPFAPGAWLGDVKTEPVQTLEALELEGAANWGEVDPVLASEVLRDVERLARV